MAQKHGVVLSKTSAFQDAGVYLIFDAQQRKADSVLDLIFDVFKNVVDLSSK